MSSARRHWIGSIRKLRTGLLVAATGLSLACDETSSSSYKTLDDARRDGAVARGWLPRAIPDSAINIRETHDIATNETWAAFELPSQKRDAFRHRLNEAQPSDLAGLRIDAIVTSSWWPRRLTGALAEIVMQQPTCDFYVDAEPREVFVACEGEAIIWFWRAAR